MAVRGPRAARAGTRPRRSAPGGARAPRGSTDASGREGSRDDGTRACVPLARRARGWRRRTLGGPRTDALALADEIGHSASAAAVHTPRMAFAARSCEEPISMRRSSTSSAPRELAARTRPPAGTRTPSSTSPPPPPPRGRPGREEALTRARAELDELPDVGVLGELYLEADDALHQRARREGFLGEDSARLKIACSTRLLAGQVGGAGRDRPVALTQHGEDAQAWDLPKARNQHA